MSLRLRRSASLSFCVWSDQEFSHSQTVHSLPWRPGHTLGSLQQLLPGRSVAAADTGRHALPWHGRGRPHTDSLHRHNWPVARERWSTRLWAVLNTVQPSPHRGRGRRKAVLGLPCMLHTQILARSDPLVRSPAPLPREHRLPRFSQQSGTPKYVCLGLLQAKFARQLTACSG